MMARIYFWLLLACLAWHSPRAVVCGSLASQSITSYIETYSSDDGTTSYGVLSSSSASSLEASSNDDVGSFASNEPLSAESASPVKKPTQTNGPPRRRRFRRSRAQLRAKVDAAMAVTRGSKCNPNVCFVMDGSARLSDDDFRQQKDFVKLVAAIVAFDEGAGLAAVSYSRRVTRLAALTSDADSFLLRMESACRQCPCSMRPLVGSGIRMCDRELKKASGAKKMVVFGDDQNTTTRRVAKRFLAQEGTGLCTVQVGGTTAADGGESDVLTIDSWSEIVDILEELVRALCDAPQGF